MALCQRDDKKLPQGKVHYHLDRCSSDGMWRLTTNMEGILLDWTAAVVCRGYREEKKKGVGVGEDGEGVGRSTKYDTICKVLNWYKGMGYQKQQECQFRGLKIKFQ